MDAVVLENVVKTFATVRAVDDLSARVPAGQIYGFLGPNGAGKTTTIRMIMNILYPDSGRIEVLGDSVRGRARERIGYMPEERGLYRKMTVRAVLRHLGAIKGMSGRDLAPAITRWLETVGLADWADRRIEELSRGMQQKIQFVATVINNPDILILDEPFAGLDPVNLDLMKRIMLDMRAAGKTVIFSTHIMDEAERLCDRLLLINKGRKIFDGTLEDIRAQNRVHAVVVEVEGETEFLRDLPMVESITSVGRRLEIRLRENADTQELLRALMGKVRLRLFEEKTPSLHEIFVRMVGGSRESDS